MEYRNPSITGATLAITLAIVNAACALGVVLWPEQAISFANTWAHGVDFMAIKATAPITFGRFVYGLVGIAALGFIVGFLYASVYNLLSGATRKRSIRAAAASR